MPWLRVRDWDRDGVPARKAVVGTREYPFLDSEGGVCFIPTKQDAEYLLRHENHAYELAWERHGIVFDAQGRDNSTSVKAPHEPDDAQPIKRGPGRPRIRR